MATKSEKSEKPAKTDSPAKRSCRPAKKPEKAPCKKC